MDRILIIMKKNNGHQGIICPFTGAFFHNMQTCLLVYTYNRSQVSVYRTIGPLVRLCGNVVYRVEKSYVDKLVARNPLHFNLLSTSPEFLIDQNQFLFEVSYTVSQYLKT